MGVAGKRRRAELRKSRKRAVKAARRQLYASYAGQGRRTTKDHTSTGYTPQRGNHVMLNCGNVGCERCFPRFRALRADDAEGWKRVRRAQREKTK
jgi:hypothetical protein